MRFEESPDLFGVGCGTSTCGDFKCDICKTLHNEGNDEAQEYDGDSVGFTNFAGLTICEDCFEKIETEILHRMADILTWFERIRDSEEKKARLYREILDRLHEKK